jgi:hypothetical protein
MRTISALPLAIAAHGFSSRAGFMYSENDHATRVGNHEASQVPDQSRAPGKRHSTRLGVAALECVSAGRGGTTAASSLPGAAAPGSPGRPSPSVQRMDCESSSHVAASPMQHRRRQLVNRERLEIDTSLCIIGGHLRREQRVLAEHSAGFCRVARGSAHCCLGRPCPARRSPQEKAVFAVFARVLAIPM